MYERIEYDSIKNKYNNSDYYYIKPYGKYCKLEIFNNTCKIYYNNEVIESKSIFIDMELNKRTVIMGYYRKENQNDIFVCCHVLYYKGKKVSFQNMHEEIWLLCDIIEKDIDINKNRRIFSSMTQYIELRLLSYSMDINELLLKTMNESSYSIICVRGLNNYEMIMHKKYMVFNIIADENPDIYKLYHNNDGDKIYYGNTCVMDYEMSKKMNKDFRKIRENDRLDYIEESEDEEDFESEELWLKEGKEGYYVCEYHDNLKMWIPYDKII